MNQGNPAPDVVVTDLDLGAAESNTPIKRRNKNDRRSTLGGSSLNAIALSNELVGEDGNHFPIPPSATPAGRTLFGPGGGLPLRPNVPPAGAPPAATGVQHVIPTGRTIKIDGRSMTLAPIAADKDDFIPGRLWDKTKRADLDPEQLSVFIKSATGYVLSKTNKLNVLSLKEDDEGVLKHVHNLKSQLKALEDHAINHDIVDVFTIVSAHDLLQTGNVNKTSDGAPETYNLFYDYPRLHPADVGTSNAWYHLWLSQNQPYIKDNMRYTFEMLHSNTDEKLWSKCLEDYEEYHPTQQGGPLMFFLILKRIQNSSESACDHLKRKVITLKISKLEGENVEHAVSLIKAAYSALLSASTPSRSYIPEDFALKVLEVMLTSSNAEFTRIFQTEINEARRIADKYGGQPEWPTVTQTLNQASRTYLRLVQTDQWDTAKKPRSSAFVAQPTTSTGSGSTSRPSRPLPAGLKCFNCEREGCSLTSCPQPRDEAKIQRNRRAFMDAKRQRDLARGGSRPQTKTARDGSRLVLNERGLYVHDAKATRKAKKKEQRQLVARLTEQVSALAAQLTGTSSSTSTTTSPPAPVAPPATVAAAVTTDVSAHRSDIRRAILSAFQQK